MARLSIWNSGRKGNTYNYIDKMISQWMGASGTGVYLHLYLGIHDQSDDGSSPPNPSQIQDVLLLENRDRKYSETVYELRGVYNVSDIDIDMRQFGFFLANDTIFIEFHLNDVIAQLGRKIMTGDVIELPHQRDDALLDGGKAVNKYYVVDDVTRASDGYSPTWYPHILRVKCSPMTAGEEFDDILQKPLKDAFGINTDGTLADLLTTLNTELEINEDIVESAKRSVKKRNFETQHLWVMPGEELTNQKPWVLAGDGIPPNGIPCGTGTSFPQNADEGEYFLRTDYWPQALFRRVSGAWRIQEYDYREEEWSVAHATLKKYINNRATVTFEDGTTANEKQGLYQAVKPKTDL